MRFYSVFFLLLAGCVAASNEALSPPPALDLGALDGQPKRSITNADLISLRDIGTPFLGEGLSVSPDGRHVAFQLRRADVETNSYDLGWFVTPTEPGVAPVYVGDGGEAIMLGEVATGFTSGAIEPGEAKWSPDGRWIAYRKLSRGVIQVWRVRADGSGAEQLTNNAAGVIKFDWSEGGDKIHFDVVTPSHSEYERALKREGETGYLFDERFIVAIDRRPILKQSIAQSFQEDALPSVSFVYDIDRRTEMLDPQADDTAIDNAQEKLKQRLANGADRDLRNVVRHGDRFAWIENTDPEFYQGYSPPLTVARFDLDYGETMCAVPECTGMVTDIWLDEADGAVYFRRREGASFSNVRLYVWAPDGGVRKILHNDDWFEGCEMAPGALICFYESWTAPRKIARIDLENGAVKTIIDPNPEFQNIKLSRVEKLEWRAMDGSQAVGHLAYPRDYVEGERYPLVIVQYRSRGFLRGGVGDEYPIHVLAANGFMVLSFDRPSLWDVAAKEDDIWKREGQYWGDDFWERTSALSALENVIDILDERGVIDPHKVGITGLSEGAESVWYAMMHSEKFAAASVSSGGWSPSTYYMVPASVRQGYYKQAAELDAPGTGGDARWRHISPEFHAKTIDTPILIQGPDSELLSAVPAYGALKDAGKPVEMYVFPDEYHVKVQPKHRAAVYERNVDWMNFWLRDVEDPDPEKAAQYERWRELRELRVHAMIRQRQ